MSIRFFPKSNRTINQSAAAAPAGTKRAVCATGAVTEAGPNPFVEIARNGVVGYYAALAGSLTALGSTISTASMVASSVITNDAMALTGTITVRFINATDPERGFSCTGGAAGSGADAIFSVALDGTLDLTFNINMSFNSVPDTATGNPARWPWNSPDTIFNTDPNRTFAAQHAQWPLQALGMKVNSDSANAAQKMAEDVPLADLSGQDPTIVDIDGLGTKFARVTGADARKWHRFRVHKDGLWRAQNSDLAAGTGSGQRWNAANKAYRAEVQGTTFQMSRTHGTVKYNEPFVWAYEIKLNADSVALGGEGTGFLLGDFHHQSGSANSGTPFYIQLDEFMGVKSLHWHAAYNQSDYGYGAMNGAVRPDAGHNWKVPLYSLPYADLDTVRNAPLLLGCHAKMSANIADGPFIVPFMRIGGRGGTVIMLPPLMNQPFGFKNNVAYGGNQYWVQAALYFYSTDFGAVDTRSYDWRTMACFKVAPGLASAPLVADMVAYVDSL